MKIAVCVKWVPVVARMQFDMETKRIVREGVPNELNAYDQLAVQRCVELREEGVDVEIDIYTMGPPAALQGLQQCLAMGADNAYHIVDPALAGSDTLATARALSLALTKGSYDLLMFGAHSVDAETGQVGPEVAEFMGIPQVTGVRKLEVMGGSFIRLERETDDAVETIECRLPAVISVVEGIAPEVFPGREAVQAAREREVEEISAKDLADDITVFGQSGSPTWVEDIQFIESNRDQRILGVEVTADEAAEQVAAYLKEKGLLDPAARGGREVSGPVAPPDVRPSEGPAIWIVAEYTDRGLRGVTSELLGAAKTVADLIKGHVVGALLGGPEAREHAAALGQAGADVVVVAADDALSSYTTEAFASTLSTAIEEARPYAVLVPSTVNGRDLAARVAARLGLGLTGDCVGLEVDAEGRLVQLKPAFGGNIVAPILSKTKPYMTTIRPGLLERLRPTASRQAPITELKVFAPTNPAVRVLEREPVEQGVGSGDIEDAWAVICVGMGVGGPEEIAALKPICDLLGAELICTRDVVDAGWMPRNRQIGLTGKSVAPALYIGVGVRGDFNHTVGIQRAGTVVVVNNSKRAQFFRACDIGTVADWHEFIPALVDRIKSLTEEH